MQIQSGKLYENKTWNYLYPCLKSYGSTLMKHLNSFYKLGVGIKDHNIDIEEGNCIYILLNTNLSSPQISLINYRENFSKFLDWIRFQPYYVIDYVYDGLDKGEKHMLVLKIPDSYNKAYSRFLKGKYSEMYTSKEINELFPLSKLDNKDLENKINSRLQKVRNVLFRNSNYLETFRKQVNEEFGVNCSLNDLKDHELDFPPDLKEESFNYLKILVE